MSRSPVRQWAPHVQAAIAAVAQPKTPRGAPPGERPLAPHVQAALAAPGAMQPRVDSPRPAAIGPAPHVQAAIAAAAAVRPRMGSFRQDVHRPEPRVGPVAHRPAARVQPPPPPLPSASGVLRKSQEPSRGRSVQKMELPKPLSSTFILKFTGIAQKKENWCFAAVTAAIYNYYCPDKKIDQEKVVKLCHGELKDKIFATWDALDKLDIYASLSVGLSKGDRILLELAKGRPIVVSLGSHAYVLYGVGAPLKDLKLYLFDPYENGSTLSVPYSKLEKLKVDRCYYTCRPRPSLEDLEEEN